MNDYKISVGIEPTDAYEKAKKDMVEAVQSVQSLTPMQQKQLAEELFGVARVASVCQLLSYFIR